MGLSRVRQTFFDIRQSCQIIVKSHAFKDYPERGFSKVEIVDLVKFGTGRFTENDSDQAIEGSYLFFPKDDEGRECKLVILVEILEMEGIGGSQKETVIVCSAYREVK